jgi:oligosaccharide reducing-end xylanase
MKSRGLQAAIMVMCGFMSMQGWIFRSLIDSAQASEQRGSYYTGTYQNLFTELLGKSESQVTARIDSAFQQLFYGDDSAQRVYYPVEPDKAYLEDILHKDVRTEGMSYGMMIAVQLNKKTEFDRLWNWAKTFMQHRSEPRKNYFAWHCRTNGAIIDSNAASDGEEWFVTALHVGEMGKGSSLTEPRLKRSLMLC